MKLSRTIAYGIHAAIQLARLPGGALTPASQLAREGGLPERFLVQILRYLVTNGVLTSACGVSGGYSLARPPAEITLRDIVESFDSPLDVCPPELACMSHGVRSQVVNTLGVASKAARAKLQKLTLEDLLRADADSAGSAHSSTPAPIGIKLHMMEANGYETRKPVIRPLFAERLAAVPRSTQGHPLGQGPDGNLKADLPDRPLQSAKPIVIAWIGPYRDGGPLRTQPLQMLE
jgi:Rrf2 family protein